MIYEYMFLIIVIFLHLQKSRDPNKYYWLFELMMKEPATVENGSFLESR